MSTYVRPLPSGVAPPGTLAFMLRSFRVRARLSQNETARRAGIDAAYVNRLERNLQDLAGSGPRRGVCLSLAEALGLDETERDRLLFAAGLAPTIDYQTLSEQYAEQLTAIRAILGNATITSTTTTVTTVTTVD